MDPIAILKSAVINSYNNELSANISVFCEPTTIAISIEFADKKIVKKYSESDFRVNNKLTTLSQDKNQQMLSAIISLDVSEIEFHKNPEVVISFSIKNGQDIPSISSPITISEDVSFTRGEWQANRLTGEVCLFGWVIGRKKEDIVYVQLDGEHRLYDASFHMRQDVSNAFQWDNNKEAGWKSKFFTHQNLMHDVTATAYYVRDDKIIKTIRAKLNVEQDGTDKPSKIFIQWSRFKGLLPGLIAKILTAKGRLWALKSKLFWRLWHNDAPIGTRLRKAIVQKMLQQHELDKNVVLRLRSGHLTNANQITDYALARKFIVDGCYERGFEEWLCNYLKEGDVFIDAGACYGHLTLSAAAVVKNTGHVYSIEANPTTQHMFNDNMEMNKVKNVTLIKKAIADSEKQSTFLALDQGSTGCSRLADSKHIRTKTDLEDLIANLNIVSIDPTLLGSSQYADRSIDKFEAKEVSVEVTTLDNICEQINKPISLIKMDLEGGEWLAIKGAKNLIDGKYGPPPTIVLEYSNLFPTAEGKRSDILDYLLKKDWRVYKFIGGKTYGGALEEFFTEEEAPHHDNIAFIPPHAQDNEK